MLTFMNLLSQLSFSTFQVLGGQNISHPAMAEKAGDPSGTNTAEPSQGLRCLFERAQSFKDEVLSCK